MWKGEKKRLDRWEQMVILINLMYRVILKLPFFLLPGFTKLGPSKLVKYEFSEARRCLQNKDVGYTPPQVQKNGSFSCRY